MNVKKASTERCLLKNHIIHGRKETIQKSGLQQNGINARYADAYGNFNIQIFQQMVLLENFRMVNTMKEVFRIVSG